MHFACLLRALGGSIFYFMFHVFDVRYSMSDIRFLKNEENA